ncbi:hypothetical protein MPTK1_3g08770 [Marchantia polymorpha subsp. ruderalis]|uniref:TPX2 C-terminal domain-containing protein n=2 Tax=Marchantia polymorpha TaxID=3197 RepID=A0A176WNP2_MARPO|nr:hypothetical protein AXG93_2528s1360 [Marchantia polymorpha subsp. ruderalis]PTQ31928.1 hypothetical protein MARPO_0105s0040 [Marchantia polymorpha]BBN04916.1 hypothetical protein Mp_3g08770 [Marchantia polymorpha subsp. ruderalis]|eukprot:PTQ31928.1 hypothetical protein MARPO_0105s0040 [Marchantia polymorpha]
MYPVKQPLQQLVYQGSPGKIHLITSNSDSGASQCSRQPTSENCDPNLEKFNGSGRSAAAFRKIDNSAAVDIAASCPENHPQDSTEDHCNSSETREETGAGVDACDQNKGKDAHKCGGVAHQQFKSPTKAAAAAAASPGAGGHAHGHRQHFCRSPRCASNNPDYATPAQVQPRKYLISKRHLLPGAICTRDPSTLTSQIPPPPSTGKPPARPPSASKPLNTFRQLSFKDASSDTSKSGPASKATCSSLDTDCGSVTGAAGNSEGSNREKLTSSHSHLDGVEPASEPLQIDLDRTYSEINNCSAADVGLLGGGEVIELRSDDSDGGSCNSELNSAVVESFGVIGEGEHNTTGASCSEFEDRVSGSVCSVEAERCEPSGFSAGAGESLESMARDVHTSEPLPPPLSGNTSAEEPLSVSSCGLTDPHVPGEFLSTAGPPIESADPPLDVEDVTKTLEQRLALEKMDVTSPRGQSSFDDGVDIYDLAAAANSGSGEAESLEKDYIFHDYSRGGSQVENDDCMGAEVSNLRPSGYDFEEKMSQDCHAEEKFVVENEDLSRGSVDQLCKPAGEPEVQRAPPRYGRSKGRQLWRNDCRDSREVVTLKSTNYNRQGGDWMVDSLLEGAVNRMKPSGEGRVRILVEAFESLMNISEPEPEKRPSRVWCFNRMGRGEVDDDGDVFEEGDQRVDCYEVSGDRLELRASMRLSLGGGTRHDVCSLDGGDSDVQMSSMQKVQDWDDYQSSNPSEVNLKDMDDDQDRNSGRSSTAHEETTANPNEFAERPSEGQAKMNDNVRRRVKMYNEVKKQLGYNKEDNVKMKIQRYNRPRGSSKSSSVKSETESNLGSAEKMARARNTNLEPFRLLTEERGAMKTYQFAKKLEQIFAEEERLRNPIAQGLPWTTDEPEVVPKPPVKQPTKHVDFTHHSDSRAVSRAEFDYYVAERQMYMDMQREEEERQRQMAEQEEIKRLRREMVPRAQLMPFFDQPFMPSRSSKRLTVPKEPKFKNRQNKRAKCMVWQQGST